MIGDDLPEETADAILPEPFGISGDEFADEFAPEFSNEFNDEFNDGAVPAPAPEFATVDEPANSNPPVPLAAIPEPAMPAALACATAPRIRPWRGFVLAAVLHGLLLGGFLLVFKPRALTAPPNQQVINMVMEAAPASAPVTPPVKPVIIPQPAPVTPPDPKPVVAPPPAPVVDKPAMLPLPAPPSPPAPPAPQPPPQPVVAQVKPVEKIAPPGPQQTAIAGAVSGLTTPVKIDPSYTNLGPDYPLAARQLGEQGPVLLTMQISKTGIVEHIVVTVSSGYSRLDAAAEAAVLRWHFTPALKNGTPVDSSMQYWIAFNLH